LEEDDQSGETATTDEYAHSNGNIQRGVLLLGLVGHTIFAPVKMI
jgi:hypothetical protein